MRVLTALALALFAGPAFAAQDSTPAADPVAVAAPEPAKVEAKKQVCRMVDVESGSRMRKRVCKTVSEEKSRQTETSDGASNSHSAH